MRNKMMSQLRKNKIFVVFISSILILTWVLVHEVYKRDSAVAMLGKSHDFYYLSYTYPGQVTDCLPVKS